MRYVWTILLLLPGGCSLAPGQLDLTKISAVNSCVQVSFQGSPAGGTASTTTTLPISPTGGAAALATDAPVAPTVTQTCTVTATTTDNHGTAPSPSTP